MPALLSLLFPGFGQLVKGQWPRALFIWAVIAAPWAGWIAAATFDATPTASGFPLASEDIRRMFMASPVFGFVLLLTGIAWIWSVVDAYNRPV